MNVCLNKKVDPEP